jgi:hypothetical protein
MKLSELKEETAIEFQLIETVVKEIKALQIEVAGRNPMVREKTAASAFLAQFYGGIENILKRICKYHNVPLPTGDTWHTELFRCFCDPPKQPLPLLFDKKLTSALIPFRKFRHVVYHGYGFHIEWDRMKKGMEEVGNIFEQVKG